jgi:putative ATP-dependent endonuclease of OLD family
LRLTRIEISNYARLSDLDLTIREHLVIVGANDVGKTSILRLLNLLLGSTAQLYQTLSLKDLRDVDKPLVVVATFNAFSDIETRLFHREIDVNPVDHSETLLVRLEVVIDPEDDESILITRWCPGRGDVRTPSREQIQAFGWRYLPAVRTSSANQLDGQQGAVRVLLREVEGALGAEREALGTIMESFNTTLGKNDALISLRKDMADHLSSAMPREVGVEDVSLRTSANPADSVLDSVSMYLARKGAFVPVAEQSDGIRQLMSMTLFDLAEGAANVIAIDEPELHLHPSSQRTVAELLSVGTNQKILVTHSPYIVQKFDPTQVVAIDRDGVCHQLDEDRLTVEERTQAHWWAPRMLEALTARVAILVEGIADRLIVEAAAKVRGIGLDRIGAIVFELGGAENFPTVYKLLGPDGFAVPILGLVDEAESPKWIGAVGGKPKNVIGRSVFISKKDLEEEYCRGLGPVRAAAALIEARIVSEAGVLSSCEADSLEKVNPIRLAKICRKSDGGFSRKVPAALAITKVMTKSDAEKLDSIGPLLTQLQSMTSP